jgi:hypothetical protein
MSMDRTFTCHGSGFLPISLLTLLAFAAVQLPAQTPIYSLPFFILFPAKYRLAKNLTYEGKEGSAIMILSSNVDLDLNGCALAVQSVEASKEAPVDAEKKTPTQTTPEQPKSTPSASPTPEISGGFLDRYHATKSSPQASPSSVRHRHRKKYNERQ